MKEVIYQEAFNYLRPDPCLFIVSQNQHGKSNVMVAAWSMKCSHTPPLFAVALSKKGYTHKVIQKSKEFVVAVANKETQHLIEQVGSVHGSDHDKIEEFKIETTKASKVSPPLISKATINMECILFKEIDCGDHILFVGEVVASHLCHNAKVLVTLKGAQGERIYEEF